MLWIRIGSISPFGRVPLHECSLYFFTKDNNFNGGTHGSLEEMGFRVEMKMIESFLLSLF